MPVEQNSLELETKELKQEIPNNEKKQKIKSIINVIAGSIIYIVAITWVFKLGGFFAGGVTGAVQLLVAIINKFVHFDAINNYFGLIYICVNIPLLIIGKKAMSKNFAILTILSIVIQTIITSLLDNFTVSPLAFLLESNGMGLFDIFTNQSFSIAHNADNLAYVDNFKQMMNPGTRLLLAFFILIINMFFLKLSNSTGFSSIL